MFLKKTRTWSESDLPVELVDQREKSPVRAAFTRAIHDGKKVSAIKSYWNRRIFSGRDVPPLELASDQEVLDFVVETREGSATSPPTPTSARVSRS